MFIVDFVGVVLEIVCIDVDLGVVVKVVSLDGVGDIVVRNVVILADVDLVVEGNLEDRADVDSGVVLDFSVVNITDDVLSDDSDATAVTVVVIKEP